MKGWFSEPSLFSTWAEVTSTGVLSSYEGVISSAPGDFKGAQKGAQNGMLVEKRGTRTKRRNTQLLYWILRPCELLLVFLPVLDDESQGVKMVGGYVGRVFIDILVGNPEHVEVGHNIA